MDERRFHAMGTVAHLAAADAVLVEAGRRRLEELDARWSRFVPDSDVSLCNAAAGSPCLVHRDTVDLVERAIDAWYRTQGRFDPTVLAALVRAGYDRSYELLEGTEREQPTGAPRPAPGPLGIAVDRTAGTVTLPAGVGIDLGGIGKGRAADLVAEELAARGGWAMVNLGGDLRAVGPRPDGSPWRIGVDDPLDPGRTVCVLAVSVGAVATSTTARRRWHVGGEAQHHLIDPATGRSSTSPVVAATVVAPTAESAEVLAKAALLAGVDEGLDLLAAAGNAGLLATADGRWFASRDLVAFVEPGTAELVDQVGDTDPEEVRR